MGEKERIRDGARERDARLSAAPTEKENDRVQREGKLRGSSLPGRERWGGSREPARRLGRGRGKRVNRESTCKQATRETNNVGAAGCSPNEAGRQAGSFVRSLRRCVFRALPSCRSTHARRVHTRELNETLHAARVAPVTILDTRRRRTISFENAPKIRTRDGATIGRCRSASRRGSPNSLQPVPLRSEKKRRYGGERRKRNNGFC